MKTIVIRFLALTASLGIAVIGGAYLQSLWDLRTSTRSLETFAAFVGVAPDASQLVKMLDLLDQGSATGFVTRDIKLESSRPGHPVSFRDMAVDGFENSMPRWTQSAHVGDWKVTRGVSLGWGMFLVSVLVSLLSAGLIQGLFFRRKVRHEKRLEGIIEGETQRIRMEVGNQINEALVDTIPVQRYLASFSEASRDRYGEVWDQLWDLSEQLGVAPSMDEDVLQIAEAVAIENVVAPDELVPASEVVVSPLPVLEINYDSDGLVLVVSSDENQHRRWQELFDSVKDLDSLHFISFDELAAFSKGGSDEKITYIVDAETPKALEFIATIAWVKNLVMVVSENDITNQLELQECCIPFVFAENIGSLVLNSNRNNSESVHINQASVSELEPRNHRET